MPRLEAKRFRRELRLHPEIVLTVDGLYDLVLLETGSEEIAEQEAREHMARQLRAGQTPS